MPNSDSPELSNEDRELLLKEADWIREDAQSYWERIDRIQAFGIAGAYALIGWLAGKAMEQPVAVSTFDSLLYTLRSRADVALPITLIPLLSALLSFATLEALARALASFAQLARQARRLGTKGTSWMWRLQIDEVDYVKSARTAFLAVISMVGIASSVGALWFAWPATQHSIVIWVVWWFDVALILAGWVASGSFFWHLKGQFERDLAR